MAINWMDNFNIYGTDGSRNARLLDGVYAETVRSQLIADPDPTAGGSQVMEKFSGGLGGDLRKVLPNARTTVGVAGRIWLPTLPVAGGLTNAPFPCVFSDVNNTPHIGIQPDPSGNIRVWRYDNGATTQIAITANPVLTAGAWKHFEAKVKIDPAAGTVDIKIEGITVLSFAGRTASNVPGAIASVQNVAQRSGWDGPSLYLKDYIIWDSTTGFNNDFMGSCQVLKIVPNADISLNWTPNPADGIGFDKINEITPDDDSRYIAAPFPAPAAYKCGLTDLPVTVTSVRGVMPIHRSRKIDGGDGNIQIGAISGASTGLGADRPITTAYTYWWDLFDTDPATAAAWTRVSVNAMNLQINRTL